MRDRKQTLRVLMVLLAIAMLPSSMSAGDKRGPSLGLRTPKLTVDEENRPIAGGQRRVDIKETKEGLVIEILVSQQGKPKVAYLAFAMDEDEATVHLADKLGANCYWREEKSGSGRDPDSLELYESFSLHPLAGPWKSWSLAVDGASRLCLGRDRRNEIGRRHFYVNLDDGR